VEWLAFFVSQSLEAPPARFLLVITCTFAVTVLIVAIVETPTERTKKGRIHVVTERRQYQYLQNRNHIGRPRMTTRTSVGAGYRKLNRKLQVQRPVHFQRLFQRPQFLNARASNAADFQTPEIRRPEIGVASGLENSIRIAVCVSVNVAWLLTRLIQGTLRNQRRCTGECLLSRQFNNCQGHSRQTRFQLFRFGPHSR